MIRSNAFKDLQLFLQILYFPKCLHETLGPNTLDQCRCITASAKFR